MDLQQLARNILSGGKKIVAGIGNEAKREFSDPKFQKTMDDMTMNVAMMGGIKPIEPVESLARTIVQGQPLKASSRFLDPANLLRNRDELAKDLVNPDSPFAKDAIVRIAKIEKALREMGYGEYIKPLQVGATSNVEQLAKQAVDLRQQAQPAVTKARSLLSQSQEVNPLIQEARKYKSAEEFVKKIKVEDFVKQQVPEITSFKNGIIKTKDGNKIRIGLSQLGNDIELVDLEAVKKGTGVGTKILQALKDYTNMRLGSVTVYKPYNESFYRNRGFDINQDGTRAYSNFEKGNMTTARSQLADIWNKANRK